MSEIKLLPCPFCGKDAQIAPDEIGSGGQHVPPYHAGCLRGAGCGIAFTADESDEAIAEWNRRATLSSAAVAEREPHPDDMAVDRFADAMKVKLAKKRDEGRNGWEDPDVISINDLSYLLIQHVWKGDPVDVGNLAMMIQQRGGRITIDEEARSITPPTSELEAENARLKVRLAEALKALEPFAAIEWADEDGWSHDSPHRERVCDWFGPSDFRAARRVREGGKVDE